MQIICPNCQAEYDLEPPAAPFARDQDLVFRCTACSTAIPLRLNESAIPDELDDEPDTDVVEAPPRVESFILLRQGGSTYRVENTAQLQRWIAERRIWPDDEVAIDGGDWQRVGDIDAYAVFFRLVEDAERVQGGTTTPSPAGTSGASATEPLPPSAQSRPPQKPRLSVSVKAGLFARPAHLDVTSDAPAKQVRPETSESPSVPATTQGQASMVQHSPDPLGDPEPAANVTPAVVAEVEEEFGMSEDIEAPVQHEAPDVAERFGEVVPEEAPRTFLTPDQPTMDMELEEEDFFSEEHTSDALAAGGGFDGDDDLVEWGQHRRKNMVMWWLMFFGALGGAAYLALDFLNSRDVQVQTPVVDSPAPADTTATVAPQPVEDVEAGGDTGAEAEATAEATAEAKDAAAEADEAAEAAPAGDPPTEPGMAEAPEPEKAKPVAPPPPKKPSASSEISRGWAQIDRENWSKARGHFDVALRMQPSNPDARFGVAYVNEQQGRMGEAVSQYCRLSATASGEVKVEAEGRLRALAKDCP